MNSTKKQIYIYIYIWHKMQIHVTYININMWHIKIDILNAKYIYIYMYIYVHPNEDAVPIKLVTLKMLHGPMRNLPTGQSYQFLYQATQGPTTHSFLSIYNYNRSWGHHHHDLRPPETQRSAWRWWGRWPRELHEKRWRIQRKSWSCIFLT